MSIEIEKNTVPKFIVDFYMDKYEHYPCFTQTRNVTYEAINVLTKKNRIIWFDKFFDGNTTTIREALIDYSANYKVMVYVKSKGDERVFNLFLLSASDDNEHINYLINALNKFYTIDIV
jgi:hypothetical protein